MKTRQRGLRRKCQNMVRRLKEETAVFPKPHPGSDYWHLHLPTAQSLIASQSTPTSVRRMCVQTLIDQAQQLAGMAPVGQDEIRVVVAIMPSELWASQIIVFFGPNYWGKFFDRKTETQNWSQIEDASLIRQWNLSLPEGFIERGYNEVRYEEDGIYKSQIWFFGQLMPM